MVFSQMGMNKLIMPALREAGEFHRPHVTNLNTAGFNKLKYKHFKKLYTNEIPG